MEQEINPENTTEIDAEVELELSDLGEPQSEERVLEAESRLGIRAFLHATGQEISTPITREEFERFAADIGLSEEDARHYFELFDVTVDGVISAEDDFTADGVIDIKDLHSFNSDQRNVEPYGFQGEISEALAAAYHQTVDHKIIREDSIQHREEKPSHGMSIHHYTVPVPGLAAELEGLTLLHLSDPHFEGGQSQKIDGLHAIAEAVGDPDFVLLTGDIVDSDHQELDDVALEALSSIAPNAIRLAVLGNHDDKSGERESIMQGLVSIGYLDMTNRNLRTLIDGIPLNFVGIDDHLTGEPSPVTYPFSQRDEFRVVLTHNLDAINNRSFQGIDLVLSGHLHDGEINLGAVDGVDYLMLNKVYQNLNDQKREWKALTWRTLSYISPGLSTHVPFRVNARNQGAALITLTTEG